MIEATYSAAVKLEEGYGPFFRTMSDARLRALEGLDLPRRARILDVGAGAGLASFFAALTFDDAVVDALEPHDAHREDFLQLRALLGLSERVQWQQDTLHSHAERCGPVYDLMIFFTALADVVGTQERGTVELTLQSAWPALRPSAQILVVEPLIDDACSPGEKAACALFASLGRPRLARSEFRSEVFEVCSERVLDTGGYRLIGDELRAFVSLLESLHGEPAEGLCLPSEVVVHRNLRVLRLRDCSRERSKGTRR